MCVRLFSIGGAFLWQDEHDDTTSPSHDRTGETRQPPRRLDPSVCSTSQRRPKLLGVTVRQAFAATVDHCLLAIGASSAGRERPMPILFPSEVSLGPGLNRWPQATMTRLVSAASAIQGYRKDDERRAQSARRPWRCTFGPRSMGSTAPMMPNPSDRAASASGIPRSCIWPGSPMLGRAWPSYTRGGYEGPKS